MFGRIKNGRVASRENVNFFKKKKLNKKPSILLNQELPSPHNSTRTLTHTHSSDV